MGPPELTSGRMDPLHYDQTLDHTFRQDIPDDEPPVNTEWLQDGSRDGSHVHPGIGPLF